MVNGRGDGNDNEELVTVNVRREGRGGGGTQGKDEGCELHGCSFVGDGPLWFLPRLCDRKKREIIRRNGWGGQSMVRIIAQSDH